jgi:hypothetical protein
VEALPTNLPQQYAGGGIVAFAEGCETQKPIRFQNTGLVPNMSGLPAYSATNPNAAMGEFLRKLGISTSEFVNARPDVQKNILDMFNSQKPSAPTMGPTVPPTAASATTASQSSLPYRLGQTLGNAGRSVSNFVSEGLPNLARRATGIAGLALTPSEIADDQAVLAAMRGESYKGQPYDVANARKVLEAAGMDPNKAPAAETKYDSSTATRRFQYTNEPYPSDTANTGSAKDRAPAKDASGLGGDSALDRRPNFGLKAPGTFTPPVSKSMIAQTQELLGGYEGADGYLERAAARDKAAADAIAQASKSVTGEAFSDYKNVLEKEAKDFGADKEQAKGMAIFKAGLAMMAGTSRHAFENIGKGAMVGAEDYQAAAKDIKKAQRENRKELSLIEQARRAEARGDRDTAIARLEASRDRGDVRDRYVGDALQKAYGIDRAQAYDLAKTQFTTQADIFRTDLAGQYGLAGNRISGEYGLKAAQVKANREPIMTPYQMARLRADAEKRVDADAVRAELAKKLKLSKTPAPGADASFDAKFQSEYDAAINGHINRFLGAGGGGGGGDFGAVDSLLDKYAPKR